MYTCNYNVLVFFYRFEQEVLGVATSAPRPPPKFTVNPTPLITKPIYNSQPC